MYNFEANRVSKWCFSLLGVSLVNNFQKMALFDARIFIGRQNSEKSCSHVSTFFHFFSVEMCFYKCKMLLNTNLSTFLPILYAKFNTQKCARLWRALVRLFTPVCATFWKIIWQHCRKMQRTTDDSKMFLNWSHRLTTDYRSHGPLRSSLPPDQKILCWCSFFFDSAEPSKFSIETHQ